MWILLACALAVGEIVSLGFFLAPFAVAALTAFAVDLAGAPDAVSVAVFLVLGVAGFGLVRPIARRHLRQPSSTQTGTRRLIGERAVVVGRIDPAAGTGSVKIGGEVWTARLYHEDLPALEPGTRVDVIDIQGATALVST